MSQIFYRARRHTREGVPNIEDDDLAEIRLKTVDKFATMIDLSKKYKLLRGMGDAIYRDLHKLRKVRNKVHIQIRVEVGAFSQDEAHLFSDELAAWALTLTREVIEFISATYPRPSHIEGHVQKIRIPKHWSEK